MNILITTIIAYFVGTFPSAWLLTKVFLKKDIREEGTGNVGAMNVYDTSNSKLMFVITFLMDVAKGYLAITLIQFIFGADPYLIRLAAVCVLLGHNYNIFLRLKGGKGLATAVGLFIAINPIIIPMWVVMYFTGYNVIQKNVQVANVVACLGSFLLLKGLPLEGYEIANQIQKISFIEFKIMYFLIILVIISKHVKPLRELYGDKEE